jgi:thiamine biosynthesis lipoprotein
MPLDELRFESLGTTCHLLGVGVGCDQLQKQADWVADMHRRLTRFEPDSELSQLNAASGQWVEISHELEGLLEEAMRAYHLSSGLVNVAVLPSMTAIGYTRPLKEGPTGAALGEAEPLPALPEVLMVRPGRALLAPGTGVDLGGIAKGWLADQLCERLGPNSLANLGGDLFARGGGPEGDGWPVGIGGVTVLLMDEGAATTSTRKRKWGENLHHLIDPRTGLPAATDLTEVSVVAQTGMLAEVYAKTALLLGTAEAGPFLAAHTFAWWME